MADDQVQQIKERINIAEVVGQYVTLRRAGRTFSGRCPFHKERTPSFHVSPERGTYKCFGCGEGGDVFSFLQKIEGSDFPTVLKQLAEKAGVKLLPRAGRAQAPEQKEKEERLRDVCEAAVVFYESKLKERTDVREYIQTRGVVEETAAAWRLGYAPAEWEALSRHLVSQGFSKDDIVESGFALKSEKRAGEIFDRFRGRIMFPIFDLGGHPIAVSGRFFEKVPGQKGEDEPAKYVNSPETALFKKSRTLYGLDRARASIRKLDCSLLVEGQFDLIMSHQSGLPFAVALSGTALTDEHLMVLGRLSKRLVLALDADAAGIRAGLKSAYMAMRAGFEVKVPTFAQGADPADVARQNPELLKAAVRTSKSAVEFFLDALRPGTKDARAYARLVEAQVLPLVSVAPSAIEKEQYIRLVASRLGVSESAVRTELAKRGSQTLPKVGESDFPDSSAVHKTGSVSTLTPLQKKAGMLLFKFSTQGGVSGAGSIRERLETLLGKDEVTKLEVELADKAEELRFRFDTEVGEYTEEAIAEDMLHDLARQIERERFKMRFL